MHYMSYFRSQPLNDSTEVTRLRVCTCHCLSLYARQCYNSKVSCSELFKTWRVRSLISNLSRRYQLMYSFEVNIRFVNPSTRRSRCERHFLGLTNPDVKRDRMHQLFCYLTLFLKFYKFTKSNVPSTLSLGRFFQ